MKKPLLLSFISASSLLITSQTVVNFNVNDCSGTNHDLFTELNSGKAVVIAFVMPCSQCVSGANMAQTAANSFSNTNPGQVPFYIIDDYGNTNCTSLTNWCNSNSLTAASAKITNSVIDMNNYGGSGMPKILILGGGSNHTIHYNVNNTGFTVQDMQTAISQALGPVSVKESENNEIKLSYSPNPSNGNVKIMTRSDRNAKSVIEVYDLLGKKIHTLNIDVVEGRSEQNLDLTDLNEGIYFLKLDGKTFTDKLIISH
jgi:hypothetical protein